MTTLNKVYIVPTEKKCTSKCWFCTTKTYHYDGVEFMNPYDAKFHDNLEVIFRKGITKFEITGGGEPFLNESLQDIINNIRLRIPNAYIKVYTNATLRKRIYSINELNISTVHWEKETISNVYQIKRDLIEELKFFFNPKEYAIRLSVPIYNGGISSADEAKQLIRFTSKYVDRYVFRPLSCRTPNLEAFYVDFELDGENIEVDHGFNEKNDSLIWWSDNSLYNNWQLTSKHEWENEIRQRKS